MATLATAAAPITNFNVTARPGNEAEDAIAVNPTNPSNVVAMSTLPDVVAGLAVGVSLNGGRTWARRVIGTTGDPLGEICCDEQLAWDRYGNLWMTYLVNTSGDVLVALSTDGGRTFTRVGDIVTNGDQPSIGAGPNSVWVSYTSSPGTLIQAFGAPVTGPRPVRGLQHAAREFPRRTAAATTEIPRRTEWPGDGHLPGQDGRSGRPPTSTRRSIPTAWARRFQRPPVPCPQLRRRLRLHPGSAEPLDRRRGEPAWDRSGGAHNGRAYLIWTQETPNESNNTDIMFQYSDDSGTTWSPAVRLNDDHTVNSQYNPAIALDQSSGDVAVSWYDTRNDLGTGGSGDTNGVPNDDFQIWATDTGNGGTTFAPNFQVSRGTSNAVDANSFFDTGDYTHAAFQSGAFWPAWSDNSNSTHDNPNGTLHQLDLYTAKVSIP